MYRGVRIWKYSKIPYRFASVISLPAESTTCRKGKKSIDTCNIKFSGIVPIESGSENKYIFVPTCKAFTN